MATELRDTGISAVGEIPWGTHFCLFYETKQDLLDLLIPYFKAGLENHEFCLCIASEPVIAQEAERALREAVPDLNRYLAEGQIEIVSHQHWYLADGHFDPLLVRQGWISKLEQGLARGYNGMRFAANVFWLEKEDWDTFADYEEKLDEVFGKLRILAVCAYSVASCSAADMLDVVRHHQFSVARRHGTWERLEGPELLRAHAEIRKLNADLERRVAERTQNLAAMNNELRREITGRQQSEEALRASEGRLQAAIDAADLVLWDYDLISGQLVWLGNQEKLFGFAPGEFDGTFRGFEKRVHPDDLEELNSIVRRAREERSEYAHEYRVIWPDGSVHWIDARGRFVYDESGQPVRMYGAVRDITERKQAEEALRRSESNFRTLADKSLQGIQIYQGQKVVYANPAMAAILGYGIEEQTTMSLEELRATVHPDDRALAEERARKRRAGEELSPSVELRVVRKDGSTRWIQSFNNPIEYNGQPAVLSVSIDITERKQAEDALRRSEDHLRLVIDTIPIMAWSVRPDSTVDFLNQRWMDYTGLSLEQYVEEPTRPIHPEDIPRVLEKWLADTSAGEPYEDEMRLQGADGEYRWFLVRTDPLHDESGKIVKWYGVSTDIDVRKRAEEALRKSERVLRGAESLGHTGSWEQDLVTGEIFNTEENLRLFFGDDRSKGTPFEDYAQAVHPDDREFVLQRRAQLLDEGGPGDIEFRVVWPDGSVHVLFGRATVVRDESGQAVRVYGTNLDITERKQAEEELRESQQLVRLVLSTLPVGVEVIDRVGDIVLVNDASKRIWGGMIVSGRERWARTKAFWHDSGKRIAQTDWASVRALSEGQTSLNELIDVETYDGRQKIIHNSVAPIRNAKGLIVGVVMVNEDVTERVHAEEEIKHQAVRAETLARIAARLNKQLDLDAVVHAVCDEAIDTFKVSQAAMSLYDKKRDLLVYAGGVNIPPEYVAIMEPLPRARFDEFVRTMGATFVIPDVQSVSVVPNVELNARQDIRTVVTATMFRDQVLIGTLTLGVVGHVREFTKEELALLKAISDQAAQAVANALLLKAANEQSAQLRALSAKLVEAQETERRAIARELHDEIGQVLTAVSANLQAIQLSPDASTLAARLDESLALVDDALSRMRDLSLDLRPSMLDDFGLVSTLGWYLERQAQRSGFEAEFVAESLEMRLPPSLETTVFRVAQIVLANVARHAQAKHVWVALRRHEQEVELVIRDDGVGFDVPSALERAAHGATLGLLSMQERARLERGELEIQSRQGQGTEIRARFPLR